MTVQGPVKEQQPDGMSHGGYPRAQGLPPGGGGVSAFLGGWVAELGRPRNCCPHLWSCGRCCFGGLRGQGPRTAYARLQRRAEAEGRTFMSQWWIALVAALVVVPCVGAAVLCALARHRKRRDEAAALEYLIYQEDRERCAPRNAPALCPDGCPPFCERRHAFVDVHPLCPLFSVCGQGVA